MAISGTPLRVELARAGITQVELSRASGIERTRLSRIVNGLHCDDGTREKIAGALGRKVSDLWPDEHRDRVVA